MRLAPTLRVMFSPLSYSTSFFRWFKYVLHFRLTKYPNIGTLAMGLKLTHVLNCTVSYNITYIN